VLALIFLRNFVSNVVIIRLYNDNQWRFTVVSLRLQVNTLSDSNLPIIGGLATFPLNDVYLLHL
jgi:hypothetical protein